MKRIEDFLIIESSKNALGTLINASDKIVSAKISFRRDFPKKVKSEISDPSAIIEQTKKVLSALTAADNEILKLEDMIKKAYESEVS